MNRTAGTWPPVPPVPPEPFRPQPSPWRPEPRPPAPPPGSTSVSLVLGEGDWLAERMLERRLLALAGELDAAAVNRAVAELALLDATGDDPVRVQLSGVQADLDAVLTVVDALDLVGAPVHVTGLGALSGAPVALLAVGDVRVVAPHATVRLSEPRSPRALSGREVEAAAAAHARDLQRLQERLAEACGQPVDRVSADMRAGRLLTAAEAVAYGLADATRPPG